MITRDEALIYETLSSPWLGYFSWKWLQELAGSYLAFKVKRKYARYERLGGIRHDLGMPSLTKVVQEIRKGQRSDHE
jgi:hypothetical protein